MAIIGSLLLVILAILWSMHDNYVTGMRGRKVKIREDVTGWCCELKIGDEGYFIGVGNGGLAIVLIGCQFYQVPFSNILLSEGF